MARLNVARSIIVESTPKTVADSLVDFKQWPIWSPWLCQETDANVTYHGTKGEPASGYAWNGERIGAGEMVLISRSDARIDCNLTFLKPWKSEAKVAFELQSQEEASTRLTWSMQSSLPFFLFFMRKSFEQLVGMDYDRGLKMFKELMETGSVNSHIQLSDKPKDLPACHYLGLDASGKLEELGHIMEKGYLELEQEASAQGLIANEAAFCHYTKMNPMKDHWVFTMGLPVEVETNNTNLRRREAVPRCAHVIHRGAYSHLGNAWATVFGAMRARKQKHLRKLGGFEVYTKSSTEPSSKQPETQLYVPIR